VAGNLIELDEARRIVVESCEPLATELVPLAEALDRSLAEEVRSEAAIPPFDNSAMDGFAVRAEETAAAAPGNPVRLTIRGESRAGHPAERPLGPGESIRISTGAVVPEGADAVVRIEDMTEREGAIEIRRPASPGAEIRRAGEDVEPGQAVIAPPTLLGPAELGVLASVGCDPVPCRRRARLALVGTGDELVEPSAEVGPGQIRDTNGVAVAALARLAGADLRGVRRVGDDPAATREVLAEALESDVAVISGGASVGEHDYVRPALEELGAEQLFWGVALRPGRPTWFGLSRGGPGAGGGLVFGLPGNPVSAVVTFLLFAVPGLRALAGLDPFMARSIARLDDGYEKRPGRAHAVRVALRLEPDGWHATPTRPEQASHILTSMLGADALAIVPAQAERIEPGERVQIEPLRWR
jgi:molybdopterin molybdotransferase